MSSICGPIRPHRELNARSECRFGPVDSHVSRQGRGAIEEDISDCRHLHSAYSARHREFHIIECPISSRKTQVGGRCSHHLPCIRIGNFGRIGATSYRSNALVARCCGFEFRDSRRRYRRPFDHENGVPTPSASGGTVASWDVVDWLGRAIRVCVRAHAKPD